MKKIVITIYTIVIVFSASAQGIQFEEKSDWSAQLKRASETKKLIFVDVYTAWCSPCKYMDKNVFTKAEVGNLYNESFINYKVDAEKGDGIKIRKQYGIDSYPSLLFIDEQGELIYRFGYANAEEMIKIAQGAQEERFNQKPIARWEQEYKDHKNDTAFLYQYLQKRNNLQLKSSDEFDTYLLNFTPEQRLSKKVIALITDNGNTLSPSSLCLSLLIDNHTYFQTWPDSAFVQKVNEAIESSMREYFHTVAKSNDEEGFENFLRLNQKLPQDNAYFSNNFNCSERFYRLNKNLVKYQSLITPKIDSLILMTSEKSITIKQRNNFATTLNAASSFILNLSNDEAALQKAKIWIEKAIALKPDIYPTYFTIYLTYGKLLYAIGDKINARIQLQKAKELTPQNDQFYQDVEAAMETLK